MIKIESEEIYFHKFCISETLRRYAIHDINLDVEELYGKIPLEIILNSLKWNNATPICEWIMVYLGYTYNEQINEGLEGWVKKDMNK